MADSIRDLWQLISGKAVLLPDELISTELNANKDKLQLCLNYFKPLSGSAKKENIGKKLPELHTNFVLKLAQYLDLNEKQCYAIYQLYLLRSSVISKKDIQEILSSEKCSASLLDKIRDFYQSERIYLLRCVKHILSNCDDPCQPHNEVFKDFAGKLLEGNNFINEIKKQYSLICGKVSELHKLTQQELKGFFYPVTEKSRQNELLLTSHQRERCEMLELVLLCYKHSEISHQDLFDFFDIFKRYGFTGSEGRRNISVATNQLLIDRIGFLETLVLIGGMDLEVLVAKFSEPSSNENPGDLMKEEQYKLFNDSINGIGAVRSMSPFLLTWTIVRHLRKDASFSKLGNKSLRLDVFEYLDEMLGDLKLHHVDHSMEYLIYSILYGMLNSVLSVFHESTLGDTKFLYKVLNKLLENSNIADSFWSLKREEGVRSLLTSSLEMFPVQFERPMEMFISLVKSGVTGLQETLQELQNLSSFTDAIDHHALLGQVGSEGWCKLLQSRKPALYPSGKTTIFEGTFGKILNDPVVDGTKVAGDFIAYMQTCDGIEILVSEVNNLIHEFQFCSPESIARVAMVMRLVGEGLRTDGRLMKGGVPLLRELVDGAARVMHKFSSIPYPPIHLLGSCLFLLHHAMQVFPQEVWRGIQVSGFLPNFSYHVKDLNEARRALNSGSYGHILMGRETVEGLYPVTEAFLELVHLCIDFPSIRESTIGMTAPVLLICQEIFTTYDKWKYSPGFSSERIGLLCLKIFQKVLSGDKQSSPSPVSMTTKTTDYSVDRLSPELAVVNSLLFSEASNSLLGIVHTGNEEVEIKLAEQFSAFTGHGSSLIEIIKGSLSVVNHLLTKHPTLATSSPHLSRALSTTPGTSVAPTFHHSPPEPFGKQTQTPHLIKSIVMYVDNRHDCDLNIQAVKLIKNIAQTFPISMLACLGIDVYDVKEIYLDRLQALTDDVNLKVAILDWLTTCIQSQPGLVEIFINDDKNKLSGLDNEPIADLFSDANTSKQSVSTESKCLDAIARLIREEKQGTYECPPELLCASLELIHSLWKEYQMTSMSYLKKLTTFWNSLFCVMNESNLKKYETSENGDDVHMKCISHVIRIIALEVFYNERNGDESPEFVDKMNSVVEGEGIKNWSEFLHKRLTIVSSDDKLKSGSELLLLAWRDLMVVLASLKKKNSMSNIGEIQSKKDLILVDLLKVLKITLTSSSPIDLKISNILSSLIVILINRWNRSIENPSKLVESSCDTLEVLLSSSLIHKCDSLLLSIVSSLVIIFKKCKTQLSPVTKNMDQIRRLMDVTCRLLQSSTLYRDNQEFTSDEEGRKRMKIFQSSSKLKLLPISAIHLLTEILVAFPASLSARNLSPSTSFSVVPASSPNRNVPPSPPTLVRVSPPSTDFIFEILGHYSVVQCLVAWSTYGLMSMCDLDLVQAVFVYFIKLAQTEKGAEMLFANGINDQLAIYIHPLYFTGIQLGSSQEPTIAEHEERISIYLLYTQLTCQLLVTLRALYLDKALEHLGMHKDRFHSVLESFALILFTPEGGSSKIPKGNKSAEVADSANKSPFNRAARKCSEENKFGANMRLYEMEILVQFINELAKFNEEWKARSPELLQSIMTRLCVWTQKSAGLLRLPRFMQSMIDGQRSGHSTTESSSQSKHIFTSEDSNTSNLELLRIQQNILYLISVNLNTLKRFSTSLVDVIYQRLDDLSPPDSFVLIDFSTPSIDENSMPTFGMFISVFNFCVELLSKVEGSRSLSPHKPSTPRILVPAASLNKQLVMFTMDQVLYLMMTHASQLIKDQRVSAQEKQMLKSYLNNELSSCLNVIHRHFRTSSPSPVSSRRSSSVGVSAPLKFNREHQFFGLADIFTKKILK